MRKTIVLILVAVTAAACSGNGNKLLERPAFQTEIDGRKTDLYTISGSDVVVQITNFGARVVSIWTPDRDYRKADIHVGHDNIRDYIDCKGERFLGAVVGPVANRIADGRFQLDGVEYNLELNDNGNTLHGGMKGVDMIVWDVVHFNGNSVRMQCHLKDGEGGFPGNRMIEVEYSIDEANELCVALMATTDAPTVMNPAWHPFFNLHGEGEGTILDHELWIDADSTTAVGKGLIPTGELKAVEGTPFDFREMHAIGRDIDAEDGQLALGAGYDHNWVIDRRDRKNIIKFADLYDPDSGRGIEVWSDNIALQFYSGNFFDGSRIGKFGRKIDHRGALVFETQHYPDSPNHPEFPSIVLLPGDRYTSVSVFKFYTKEK